MTSAKIISLVAVREMRERLRNRAFIISNVLTVSIILGAILILPLVFGDDPIKVGLTGEVPEAVQTNIQLVAENLGEEVEFTEFNSLEAAESGILDGTVSVVLDGTEQLISERAPGSTITFIVNEASAAHRFGQRIEEAGLNADQTETISSPDVPIGVRTLDDEPDGFFNGAGAASVGVVLLFMGITFYGGTVLTGVLEEKTSRVVEVVLATVRPWQLLAGKVLGLGILGVAQLVVLVGLGLTAAVVADLAEVPAAAFSTAAWIVIWFILGFAFYSVLYAMGGALAGRLEDAQSTAAPAGILVLIGYLVAFIAVVPNPDGVVAKTASVLPPFAPFAMPALIAVGEAAVWQMVLAPVLMAIAIVVMIRMAGRVYAGAVMHTGEKLNIRDAWQKAADLTP